MSLLLIALGCPTQAQQSVPQPEHKTRQQQPAEIPRCEKPLGTISIVTSDNQWWRELNLESPDTVLKALVQRSGCFKLVDRGQSLAAHNLERALAENGGKVTGANIGGGQVKAADYVLQPDIATSDNAGNGAAIGGIMGGFLGKKGALAGGLNVKRQEANTTLSIVNTRTTEEEALTKGYARKNDLSFGGGAGGSVWRELAGSIGGYQNTDMGQMIVLSYLDAYTKLVAQIQEAKSAAVKDPTMKLGAYAPGTRDADHETPFIPWPPPRPSSMEEISSNFTRTSTYGGIDRQISDLLRKKGYRRKNYFRVPGGFGLTTEVERMKINGQPDNMRWSAAKVPATGSWWDYLRALFMGDTGRFRLLVFVVSDVEPMPSNDLAKQYQVDDWTQKGRAFLSNAASKAPASAETRVWLLVYEFVNSNSKDQELIADTKSSFPFSTHAKFLGLK